MKSTKPISDHKRCCSDLHPPSDAMFNKGQADDRGYQSTIRKTQRRYATMAMTMAVFIGAVLMLLGYPALGKGLILGAVFSVLNFSLIAAALPFRLGKGRGQSFLFSIISICLRFTLMALPLVWALKQDAFAVSTAAAGLFMVQLAIIGDHLVARWRQPLEAG